MFPLMLSFCGLGTAFCFNLPGESLLAYALFIPIVRAVLITLTSRQALSAHRTIALYASVLTLLIVVRLWALYIPWAAEPFQQMIGFTRRWRRTVWVRLQFRLDRFSLWMVVLTAFLMPLAVLCSWVSMKNVSQSFFALLLRLESFLIATFTSLDLLQFYILYECALLPMFLLIRLRRSRSRKVKAAYLLVIYTLIRSLALLPCVLLMYSQAGSTSFLLLAHENWAPQKQLVLWWRFFLAFAVKVPMIPFHLWLPEAHVEASTARSVLLARVLLKLRTYRLLRWNYTLLPYASQYYRPFVLCLSTLRLVYASLTTLRQVDLKKIVAYSSVAHMGMLVMALFTHNSVGIVRALFLMIAHRVASPALFLLVRAMYDRAHTKALKYLRRAATTMPLFSLFFFLFSLCNMALPLSPNFVGEFLCLCGIFSHNGVSLLRALVRVLLSAAYTMWAYARVVHRMPKPYALSAFADLNKREFWCLFPLLVLALWWRIKPTAVLERLQSTLLFSQSLAQTSESLIQRINSSHEPISWILKVN